MLVTRCPAGCNSRATHPPRPPRPGRSPQGCSATPGSRLGAALAWRRRCRAGEGQPWTLARAPMLAPCPQLPPPAACGAGPSQAKLRPAPRQLQHARALPAAWASQTELGCSPWALTSAAAPCLCRARRAVGPPGPPAAHPAHKHGTERHVWLQDYDTIECGSRNSRAAECNVRNGRRQRRRWC